MLINVKMPTIVGILIFMSRMNCVLSCVETEKKFYNLGVRLFCFNCSSAIVSVAVSMFCISSSRRNRLACVMLL